MVKIQRESKNKHVKENKVNPETQETARGGDSGILTSADEEAGSVWRAGQITWASALISR